MTSEIDGFIQANSNLQRVIHSGQMLKVVPEAFNTYHEGVKFLFNNPGFGKEVDGVIMAAFAPVGLPLLVSASIFSAVISKIGIEKDFKKVRK